MKELWYVHYTVDDRKCAEGPYTVDEAIARRREIAKTATNAIVSNDVSCGWPESPGAKPTYPGAN